MAGIHAYSSLTAEMPSIVGHGHRVSRCCSQPRGPAAGVAPARRRSVGQKYRVHSLPDFDEPDVSAQEDVRQPANGSSSSSRAGSAAMPSAAGLVKTRFIAETLLPTRNGRFRLRGYKHSLDGGITFTEPTAIIYGEVEGKADVPVRVHDACFTSEVLGSLKCDCAEQLELALRSIQEGGMGMVIYLQQEGRGIGLANKIAAYALQEQGLDTVDANRALGLPDDCREYTSVANILRDLRVRSVQLMTNNPRKLTLLQQLGIAISGRIPCQVQAGELNAGYLSAKRERMDHLLDGSWCYWDHDGEPQTPTMATQAGGGMGLPDALDAVSAGLASHTVALDEEVGECEGGEGDAGSTQLHTAAAEQQQQQRGQQVDGIHAMGADTPCQPAAVQQRGSEG